MHSAHTYMLKLWVKQRGCLLPLSHVHILKLSSPTSLTSLPAVYLQSLTAFSEIWFTIGWFVWLSSWQGQEVLSLWTLTCWQAIVQDAVLWSMCSMCGFVSVIHLIFLSENKFAHCESRSTVIIKVPNVMWKTLRQSENMLTVECYSYCDNHKEFETWQNDMLKAIIMACPLTFA